MTDPTGRSSGGNGAPERLPIKLILPNQGASKKVTVQGSNREPLRDVTEDFRRSLDIQVGAISEALRPQLERTGAAPIRVQLMHRALAKSHRPNRLFSERTCPIIGAGQLGELYVKATSHGLATLRQEIRTNASDTMVKELSTVEAIEPVTPEARRKRRTARQILQQSPRVQPSSEIPPWFLTRVRLFDFGHTADQDRLVADFRRVCAQRDLVVSNSGYGLASQVYAVACRTEEDIEVLSRIIGVRSIIGMPLLRTIRSRAINETAIPQNLPLARDLDGDFPVVVVVDSGVSEAIPPLQGWVVGRQLDVAEPYRNPTHGTFVAGLIVWGDRLNPHLQDIDSNPCGVFDLQVIPNWDPAYGETESVTEQEFLQSLENALTQHANRYKVWNLSLGTDEVCAEDEFSALAEQLDNLQEKYRVSFVISAGNYETPPLLAYPRTGEQLTRGRITSPADSVLGISVGAISHLDYRERGPKRDEPSPFSRHGAGPNYIIKPDLMHYGGTCSIDAQHIAGVRSLTAVGSGEDIGTSFAAPLVSRTLAQVYHQIAPTPSPVLARALLTHHARDPRTGGRVPGGEEDFLGFGRPVPPPYCLACEPYQSTLVFEDVLRPGFFLEWDDFPYPPSLIQSGRYYGEVTMTIAFAPARGARWGTEYCETHIDAHLGVYRTVVRRKDKSRSEKFFGLVPPEHSSPGRLYEDVQVRELRKWAPVRTYYGNLSKGERGSRWRLMVRLLTRHGVEDYEAAQSQPFALIVTIADPLQKAPVYDEMAQLIRNRYQAENLAVRTAARIRART